MSEINYGNKYAATKGLPRAAIAKLIRADIKAAIKAGELPAAKYSVTCQGFSGGGSINVAVSNVAKADFVLMNRGRIQWDLELQMSGCTPEKSCSSTRAPMTNHNCPSDFLALHSAEASALLKTLEGIVGAYNYNGSDSQTDYFNVRFYGSCKFDWKYEATLRATERTAVEAELEDRHWKRLAALKAEGEAVAAELGIAPASDTIPAPAPEMPANDVDGETTGLIRASDIRAAAHIMWLESLGALS